MEAYSILIQGIGKKFRFEWVFRRVEATLRNAQPLVITGPNGSGKSTLLQILAGIIPPSEGKVVWKQDQKTIPIDQWYRYLSLVAPYQGLVEEYSLLEHLIFHEKFKPYRAPLTPRAIVDRLGLQKSKNKPIKFFSSGMKQRLRLGLAIYSAAPFLFLDEPCTNLDKQGIAWYQEEMEKIKSEKLLIVSSNVPEEYIFCEEEIQMNQFKGRPRAKNTEKK